MAHCSRCGKFLLFAPGTGLCKECDIVVQEENRRKAAIERKKKEEAQRNAEEERRRIEEVARKKAEEEKRIQEEKECIRRREEEFLQARRKNAVKMLEEAKDRIARGQISQYLITILHSASDCAEPQSETFMEIQELLSRVEESIDEEKYTKALDQFAELNEMAESKELSVFLLAKTQDVINAFTVLGGYKDSKQKVEECQQKKRELEAALKEKQRIEEEERKKTEEKKFQTDYRDMLSWWAVQGDYSNVWYDSLPSVRPDEFVLRNGIIFKTDIQTIKESEKLPSYTLPFKSATVKEILQDWKNAFTIKPASYTFVEDMRKKLDALIPSSKYGYAGRTIRVLKDGLYRNNDIYVFNMYGFVPEQTENELYYFGQVAGKDNAVVQYVFDEEQQLKTMRYRFCVSLEEQIFHNSFDELKFYNFNDLFDLLQSKYGEPLFRENDLTRIMTKGKVSRAQSVQRWIYDEYCNPYTEKNEEGHLSYGFTGTSGNLISDDCALWMLQSGRNNILISASVRQLSYRYLKDYLGRDSRADELSAFIVYRFMKQSDIEKAIYQKLSRMKKAKEDADQKAQETEKLKKKQLDEI